MDKKGVLNIMLKINGKEVLGKEFAYDGCHKIYIIEDKEDREQAKEFGYSFYPISDLQSAYENSCELKFINNWKLDKTYVGQFENATFERGE